MNGKRIWYPFTFTDRNARMYRVSFLVAEEATWDHRFHDLEGHEIDIATLDLTLAELRMIQASCDGAIGSADARRAAPGTCRRVRRRRCTRPRKRAGIRHVAAAWLANNSPLKNDAPA